MLKGVDKLADAVAVTMGPKVRDKFSHFPRPTVPKGYALLDH